MSLARAQLKAGGGPISLQFNPASLTIKVQNQLEDSKHSGDQLRQVIGKATSSLSFEAVFDTTRPDGGGGDVRQRTKPIMELLLPGTGKTPKRVTFSWGTVLFEGVVTEVTETLDYFGPQGTALRAKLAITINEQKFQYHIEGSGERFQAGTGGPAGGGGVGFSSRSRGSGGSRPREPEEPERGWSPGTGSSPRPNEADPPLSGIGGSGGAPDRSLAALGVGIERAADVARENGLDSLLDLAQADALRFEATRTQPPQRALHAVEQRASVQAGVSLSAEESLEVFGQGALSDAVGDVSLGRRGHRSSGSPRAADWAPDGPSPGSRAAANAALVRRARAGAVGDSFCPLPLLGSPPSQCEPGSGLEGPVIIPRPRRGRTRCAPPRAPWEPVGAKTHGDTGQPRPLKRPGSVGDCGCSGGG